MKFQCSFLILALMTIQNISPQEIPVEMPVFDFSVSGEGQIKLESTSKEKIGMLSYGKQKAGWSGLIMTSESLYELTESSSIILRFAEPLEQTGWRVTVQDHQSGIPMENELAPGQIEYKISFNSFSIPKWYINQNGVTQKYSKINQILLSTPTPNEGGSGQAEIESITLLIQSNSIQKEKKTTTSGITITGYNPTSYVDDPELIKVINSFSGSQINFLVTFYADEYGKVTQDRKRTPTSKSVSNIIDIAKKTGTVGLYLYVDFTDGQWRALNPINIPSWESALKTYLNDIAVPPDFICLSSEMTANEGDGYSQHWISLITSLKIRWPSVSIAYAFDKNSPVLNGEDPLPKFLSYLDMIGITAWANGSNVSELAKRTETLIGNVEAIAKKMNKKVFIAEFGIPSEKTGIESPWEVLGKEKDNGIQQEAIQALLPAFKKYPAYYWRLEPGKLKDAKDYTVIGKPAETTIRNWLASSQTVHPTGLPPNTGKTGAAQPVASEKVFSLNKPAGVAKANAKYLIDDAIQGSERSIIILQIEKGMKILISGKGYSQADTLGKKGSVIVNLDGIEINTCELEYQKQKANTGFVFEYTAGGEGKLEVLLTASDWGSVLTELSIIIE